MTNDLSKIIKSPKLAIGLLVVCITCSTVFSYFEHDSIFKKQETVQLEQALYGLNQFATDKLKVNNSIVFAHKKSQLRSTWTSFYSENKEIKYAVLFDDKGNIINSTKNVPLNSNNFDKFRFPITINKDELIISSINSQSGITSIVSWSLSPVLARIKSQTGIRLFTNDGKSQLKHTFLGKEYLINWDSTNSKLQFWKIVAKQVLINLASLILCVFILTAFFINLLKSKEKRIVTKAKLQMLKENSERIESIVNNVPGIFYRALPQREWRIVYLSNQSRERIGYTCNDFLERKPNSLFAIIDKNDRERVTKLISSCTPENPTFEVKYQLTCKKGNLKNILDRGRIQFDEAGKMSTLDGVLFDITDQVELEKELETERARAINSSKMVSLGEMAGGIAHEINNPLAIIQGFSSQITRLCEEETVDREKIIHSADKIGSTVVRISKIINGLRKFSRDGSKDAKKNTDVNALLIETMDFCKERYNSHDIKVEFDFYEDNPFILCRQIELMQVLVNLLNNSLDAIDGTDKPWVKLESTIENKSLKIKITDSGNGIPKDIQSKIMQPFFTTKEIGHGTGLGLSISKGIIEDHGGKFYIEDSNPNTCFVIEFSQYTLGNATTDKKAA